jgi:malonyl-CoA O-methyltransferase
MLWSNLALAWTDDPAAVIGGWGRALATGGLAMFTTFGPDTLRELAAAFARADDAPHVHAFVDMHDLGDALLAAGFAEPVVDMEILTLTYPGPGALLAELHAAGFANVHVGRRRTLTGRGRWARMLRAYGDSARDGRVPATFEVVYGHAWKGRPRTTADGRAVIHLERPRKGTKNI